MDKPSKSKSIDPFKVAAIRNTALSFQVTESYVRSCVNGRIKYGQYEEIKKHYSKLFERLHAVVLA